MVEDEQDAPFAAERVLVSRLRRRLARWVERSIAVRRRARLVERAARWAKTYWNWYENVNFDPETNGEMWVVSSLAAANRLHSVFDVGANVGAWTAGVKGRAPRSHVHAFEIVPSTADALRARTAGLTGVVVNDVGLSSESGEVAVKQYPDRSALATTVDYPHGPGFDWTTCPVTTGDEYCRRQGVEHIDMLKIDVEGSEMPVLRGFSGLFGRGGIDIVQFEYGRVSILTHVLLADFYEFFERHGFCLGKIYPTHVEFRPYTLNREDFLDCNYLAVRTELREVVDLLKG
jgi:FkbM family methyltransferase